MEGVFYWGKGKGKRGGWLLGTGVAERRENGRGNRQKGEDRDREKERDGRWAGPFLKGNIMNVHRRCS